MTSQYYSESQSSLTKSQRCFYTKSTIAIVVLAIFMALFYAKGVEAVGSYPAVDPNMVLYYHFNNQSAYGENDTKVYDFSIAHKGLGNLTGYPLYISSSSYMRDGSFLFDGGNDFINVSAKSFDYANFSQFSISVWVKPANLSTAFSSNRILNKNNHFILYLTNSSGYVNFDSIGLTDTSMSTNVPVINNMWNHVVVTYNGTLKTIYINNINRKTEVAYGSINQSGLLNSLIIGSDTGASFFFNGSIDELIVYNRSLEVSEINEIYYNYMGACNDSLYENCLLARNITLGQNLVYSLADSEGDGSIIGNASNIVLDCNGSIIKGSRLSNSTGINNDAGTASIVNVIVKNCTIQDYNIGIRNRASDLCGFYNNTFLNNSIGIALYTSSDGNILQDNSFFGTSYRSIDISNSQYNYVYRNYFNNSLNISAFNGATKGFIFTDLSSNYTNISNNIFTDSADTFIRYYSFFNVIFKNSFFGNSNYPKVANLSNTYKMIYSDDGTANISSNNFTKTQYPIFLDLNSRGSWIYDNLMFNTDIGLRIGGFDHIVRWNNFTNVSQNYDFYDLGIKLFMAKNVSILNNYFYDIGSTGIWVMNSTNISISNNRIYGINLLDRYKYYAYDNYEPSCGIRITPTYHSWITENKDVSSPSVSTFSVYRSDGINISNNTITGFNLLFWNQGGKNVYQDLNGFWYRMFSSPNYIYNLNEFYVNNAYENVTSFTGGVINITKTGYRNVFDSEYYISKNYQYFINLNGSDTHKTEVYNQTSALFTNGTSICNGSSSNLALNTGQVNITLRPGESCWVLDNHQLVEGTPRQYDPLWFSSSSPTEKRIASNLSQQVNTTVIINVGDCNNLMTLTYTTHSGDYSKTYNRAELDSMCSSNFVTLTNVEIEPATASNTISLTYQFDNVEIAGLCTRLVGGFSTAGEFIVIISLAIVAAFIIFTIQGRVDGKWLAGGIIGVALGAIAIIISSVLISGVC